MELLKVAQSLKLSVLIDTMYMSKLAYVYCDYPERILKRFIERKEKTTMKTPNAIKVCNETGGYIYCEKCPIFAVCCAGADYPNTEEFEKAIENAATEYLKGVRQ